MIRNINRQRLLVGLLGIPVALMGLELESRDAEQPILINDDQMAFFENEMATRWEVMLIGGPLHIHAPGETAGSDNVASRSP